MGPGTASRLCQVTRCNEKCSFVAANSLYTISDDCHEGMRLSGERSTRLCLHPYNVFNHPTKRVSLTVKVTKLQIMIESWDEVFDEFSAEVVEALSAVHLAFEAKCEMVGNRTLEVWIPGREEERVNTRNDLIKRKTIELFS